MNLELSKGTVIALIVLAVLVVGGLVWKVTQPKVVPLPADFDPSGGMGGASAPAPK